MPANTSWHGTSELSKASSELFACLCSRRLRQSCSTSGSHEDNSETAEAHVLFSFFLVLFFISLISLAPPVLRNISVSVTCFTFLGSQARSLHFLDFHSVYSHSLWPLLQYHHCWQGPPAAS